MNPFFSRPPGKKRTNRREKKMEIFSPEVYKSKFCKTKVYPIVGRTTVYMRHNRDFGKCLIHDGSFITPNMPKLSYAVDFKVNEDRIVLKGLNPILRKFKTAYVFEKRDGFNCLFYQYKDKVIPKTRQNPIATGKLMQIIQLRQFPIENIEKMVKDGFVPVFEVWGTILDLDKFKIVHGPVDIQKVKHLESLPDLNVDLIAVMKADYKTFTYTYLPPDKIIKLAKEYDLNSVKFHHVLDVSFQNVLREMKECEDFNLKNNSILTEGRVLHCYNGNEYEMFKLKPLDIMKKDVILRSTVPVDRIKAEISKILVENDISEVARNPQEYFEQLLNYLREDYNITRKMKNKVKEIFIETVAWEFLKKYPECQKFWEKVHPMFIGTIKRFKREVQSPKRI